MTPERLAEIRNRNAAMPDGDVTDLLDDRDETLRELRRLSDAREGITQALFAEQRRSKQRDTQYMETLGEAVQLGRAARAYRGILLAAMANGQLTPEQADQFRALDIQHLNLVDED